MDGQCFSAIPPYFNTTCELLNDVEEPSLSSLDESVTSFLGARQSVKEDSFSDGEMARNMMTSTPQKRNDQRRSVSLVDVSKIDAFTSRPLSNMLASWETIGSQSSVGKSRDSGYIHSGSLISVNSGKLSEIKSSDQVNTILEECTRLKRELEYSEVLINTLQESNNELRMKCAAAHNRISELRLKCVNHCDCCSQQYSRETIKHSTLSNSVFLASSDSSSSSDSSRSPSPEPPHHSFHPVHGQHGPTFLSPISKASSFSKSDEEACSDVSIDSPCRIWSGIAQNQTFSGHSTVKKDLSSVPVKPLTSSCDQLNRKPNLTKHRENTLVFSNLENFPEDRYTQNSEVEVEQLFETPSKFENKNSMPAECWKDIESVPYQASPIKRNYSTESISKPINGEYQIKTPVKDYKRRQVSSIEDLVASVVEEEKDLPVDKPVFVANEVNGKICVGNFQVWGGSSVKVASKSPLLTQSPSSVKVRSATVSCEKLNLDHVKQATSDTQPLDNSSPNNIAMRVSLTAHSSGSGRPFSVYSSFPSTPPNALSRQLNSNHSLNNHSYQSSHRPSSHNSFPNVSSRRDSLNITVTSKYDKNQHYSSNTSSLRKSNSGTVFEGSKNYIKNNSFELPNRGDSCKIKTQSLNPSVTSCQENLSNLGVSVSKKESRTICPESLKGSWKSLKSKFEKISLGYLMSSDLSGELKYNGKSSNNAVSGGKINSPRISEKKPIVLESDDDSMSSSTLSHCTDGKENISRENPENIQECWDKACELAMELSKGIARIPPRLEYIQNIGKP